MIWTRAFENKTPKGIFPDGAEKNGEHKFNLQDEWSSSLKD